MVAHCALDKDPEEPSRHGPAFFTEKLVLNAPRLRDLIPGEPQPPAATPHRALQLRWIDAEGVDAQSIRDQPELARAQHHGTPRAGRRKIRGWLTGELGRGLRRRRTVGQLLIRGSCVVLAADSHETRTNSPEFVPLLRGLDALFNTIFTVEAGLKLVAFGPQAYALSLIHI